MPRVEGEFGSRMGGLGQKTMPSQLLLNLETSPEDIGCGIDISSDHFFAEYTGHSVDARLAC